MVAFFFFSLAPSGLYSRSSIDAQKWLYVYGKRPIEKQLPFLTKYFAIPSSDWAQRALNSVESAVDWFTYYSDYSAIIAKLGMSLLQPCLKLYFTALAKAVFSSVIFTLQANYPCAASKPHDICSNGFSEISSSVYNSTTISPYQQLYDFPRLTSEGQAEPNFLNPWSLLETDPASTSNFWWKQKVL